jgi:uncharacterized phage protein (TIGR02220 family)
VNSLAKAFPWRKQFVAEYLTDQRVQLATPAARGVLLDIECLAYVGESPGRLMLQGRAMTAAEIARLRGYDVAEVEKAIAELLALGLLTRDESGVLCCPSLLAEASERERERTKKRRQRQGGNGAVPALSPESPATVPQAVPPQSQSQNKSQSQKKRETDWSADELDAAKGVLNHLNEASGANFRPTPTTLRPVVARLREGYSKSDCLAVVDNQCREWLNDRKMQAYLRPATLFSQGKFPGYLAAAHRHPVKTDAQRFANGF